MPRGFRLPLQIPTSNHSNPLFSARPTIRVSTPFPSRSQVDHHSMTPINYGPVGDDIGTLAQIGALTARTVLGAELTAASFAVVEHQIAPKDLPPRCTCTAGKTNLPSLQKAASASCLARTSFTLAPETSFSNREASGIPSGMPVTNRPGPWRSSRLQDLRNALSRQATQGGSAALGVVEAAGGWARQQHSLLSSIS